ncbi:hypothetical protein KY333_03715 [Candidatus Woesearchaeota archaeon]|nr:hypothetical protein [Candidatus Woesearchaeota archaeon]
MINLKKIHKDELKKARDYTIDSVKELIELFKSKDGMRLVWLRKQYSRNRIHFKGLCQGLSWLFFRQYLRLICFKGDVEYQVIPPSQKKPTSLSDNASSVKAGDNSFSKCRPDSLGAFEEGKASNGFSLNKKNSGSDKE